jgi:hypothetical protein
MKLKSYFQVGSLSVITPIHKQLPIIDRDDLIMKAYYAGMISHNAIATLWGIGSKSGTNWAIGLQIEMSNVLYSESQTAFQWFTDIYNQQKRNKGRTNRKSHYALTIFEEARPLVEFMGLDEIFETTCNEIMDFDALNDLQSEVHNQGTIKGWEHRTIKREIPLRDYSNSILNTTINSLMSELIVSQESQTFEDILSNAFIEGQRGLTLGTSDMELLRHGRGLLEQYPAAA